MNNFYIVRHGESEKNFPVQIESCTMKSASKYPLTKKGKHDANREAKKYNNFFDIIITSPFLRAKQTAKSFFETSKSAEFIEDMKLKDLNVGIFDDKLLSDSDYYRNEELKNKPDKKFGGGENLYEVQERMMKVVKDANKKYQNKNILLVSHGSPIEVLSDSFQGKELSYWNKCFPHTKVIALTK
ncbi:TPA: histidine phosphatase family protein [Candidatus Gracilibacteria bacterium]|nr:histidine phosphatase family protein [Candidatus Gracilibacteria bacterium]